jgi:hypothetical protein
VADLVWLGDGPVFTIEAGARPWQLDLGSSHPCLAWSDQRSSARLLGLDHVAAVGWRDESAFAGGSLASFECHRGRIQAIFAPPEWPGLNIRAAWGPTPDRDGFDLEVQVWSTSTGVFRRLEAAIASSWSESAGRPVNPGRYSVEPRDVHAAALSYDGRESAEVLRWLSTRPVPAASPHELEPVCFPIPGPSPRGARYYLEMVRPSDCARRIVGVCQADDDRPGRGQSMRYGLFGHDLEKGVVLRGRLRGVWLSSPVDQGEAQRRYEAFLAEPPALGP